MVMLEWGSCGQVAVRDRRKPLECVVRPSRMVPRARLFPTSPVSADAVLLTTMRLEPSRVRVKLGADAHPARS